MVVKVYVSLVSGNKEIKGKQEVLKRLLESKKIEFEEVDITDSANEQEKMFMREHSLPKDGQKIALPPQIFNDTEYCGDYDDFYEANEEDEVLEFLKLAPPKPKGEEMQNEQSGDHQKEDALVNAPVINHRAPPPAPTSEVSTVVLGSLQAASNGSDPDAASDGFDSSPPPLVPRSSSLGQRAQLQERQYDPNAKFENEEVGAEPAND